MNTSQKTGSLFSMFQFVASVTILSDYNSLVVLFFSNEVLKISSFLKSPSPQIHVMSNLGFVVHEH